jgi:hypothetical protein
LAWALELPLQLAQQLGMQLRLYFVAPVRCQHCISAQAANSAARYPCAKLWLTPAWQQMEAPQSAASVAHTLLLLLLLLRRWVVINKDPSKAGSLTLRVPKASGYATSASVSRLLASSSDPLSATNGISLAGVTYGDGIAKSGTETMESLASSKSNGSGLEFALYMPPGSAALVRLPRKSVPLYEKAAGLAGNRVL